MNDDYNNTDLTELDDAGEPLAEGDSWNDGNDDFGDQEFDTTTSKKRIIGTGPLLIIAVIGLAVLGLWSMRTLAIAMANSSEADQGLEATIESFLNTLGEGASTSAGPSIVLGGTSGLDADPSEVLGDDRTQEQIPLEDVQKDPFILFLEPQDEPADIPTDFGDTGPDPALVRQEKIDTFENAAAKLRVIMILGGSTPMANVSGRIVHKGDLIYDDMIGVEFEVIEIGDGIVVLAAEDKEIELYYEIPLRLFQNQ